jgi:hypothetical protein
MGLMSFTLEEVHALEISATLAERERIIKLLEQASLEFEQYDFNAVGITNGLIALIKGESKSVTRRKKIENGEQL